jgi:hypothetical protein
MNSPHPTRGDRTVASASHVQGDRGPVPPGARSPNLSAGDACSTVSEPSGSTRPTVVPPTSAGSTISGEDGHTHIPVVLWEQPSSPDTAVLPAGWWLDAPSGLVVALALLATVSVVLVPAFIRELKRLDVHGEAGASARVPALPRAAGQRGVPSTEPTGGPTQF